MNGYKAAINAFQDRYRMFPGDSSTAATKVGNSGCTDSTTGVWIESNPKTNCGAVELLP
jgi:hypothetical protein